MMRVGMMKMMMMRVVWLWGEDVRADGRIFETQVGAD
jgi:hypothetical protein